ncbi:MAG: DUF4194 domain-containing protein [Gammaproteobacteria bacterium]
MQDAPPFDESKIAAVRLLQGPVYIDERVPWDLILTHCSKLSGFFTGLGLMLVISEADGFAFIRQFEEDEMPEGYERLPTLMRRARLGFDATLIAVLLREELRRFDEDDLDSEVCVLPDSSLFDAFADFFAESFDEKKLRRKFDAALSRVEEVGFLKRLDTEPPQYAIRPIVKARITPQQLRHIRQTLSDHLGEEGAADG